ncbi:phosphodiesterase [Acuticoccus sp. M5D2P5]|uniref:phosphodiesterase n=1 Tax=Acuticoccus kalidii TaxID=2910977 RepID=UPI001F1E08A9|nr:phosphodiesterase [Acuticoccus kalidii]MCF3936552.1 phosphodiesterase [Acuticoccus kalidii]
MRQPGRAHMAQARNPCYLAAMPVFAQLTDFHLRPPGTLTLGEVDTDRLVSAAIDRVNAEHPEIEAVLVTGDLTDLGEEEAYNRAAMLLARFAVPVLVIPGNHDRADVMRDAFAAFPGVATAAVDGKICHATEIGGVTVVSLDTLVANAPHGTVGVEQLDWLDATLAAATGPALVAMHHPPFAVGIGFMDRVSLTDSAALAAVLTRHPNVMRVVCGHVHRTIVGAVGRVPAIAVPGVAHQVHLSLSPEAGPALVMEPPAYGIHIVRDGETISHVAYVDDYGPPIPVARGQTVEAVQ